MVIVLDDALRLLEVTRQAILNERSFDLLGQESGVVERCLDDLRDKLKDAALYIDDGDL